MPRTANTTKTVKNDKSDEVFTNLFKINVNDKVENKNGLNYLSWSWAWAEVVSRYPDANYHVHMFDDLPYVYDENTGYMVFTDVTIQGTTRSMWLPVMDANNKSMKKEPYTYKTFKGEKTVEAATMFDINKTIMRCLAKNLAMFGLGLYIYAGEDLPELTEPQVDLSKLKKNQVEWLIERNNLRNANYITKDMVEELFAKIEAAKKAKEEAKAEAAKAVEPTEEKKATAKQIADLKSILSEERIANMLAISKVEKIEDLPASLATKYLKQLKVETEE